MARKPRTTGLYPAELESWWLRQLRRLHPGRDEETGLSAIRSTVARLSDVFTLDRADFQRNYADEQSVLAYGLFFFPQTLARVRLPLRELLHARGWRPQDPSRLRLLDIGCGSGAATFAAVREWREASPNASLSATGIDASPGNLEAARNLAAEFLPGAATFEQRTLRADTPPAHQLPDTGPWDLILMAFSFNELRAGLPEDAAAQWIRSLLGQLAPGGVLALIEPALSETSLWLMSLRDWLLQQQAAHLWGPCPHAGPCPMLAEGLHWCHDVRRWAPPPSLEFINRTLHRDLFHLKYSFLLLGNSPPPPAPPGTFRLVAPMRKSPGRFLTRGCADDGPLAHFDWLTRHLDKEQKQTHLGWERGTLLHAPPPPPSASLSRRLDPLRTRPLP